MISPNITMMIIWIAGAASLFGAAALSWLVYYRTQYTAPYAFALSSGAFAVAFLLNAFMRSPLGYEYATQLILVQRSAFITAAILQVLAIDALAASYNDHRSLLRRFLAPIERWYLEQSEDDKWIKSL